MEELLQSVRTIFSHWISTRSQHFEFQSQPQHSRASTLSNAGRVSQAGSSVESRYPSPRSPRDLSSNDGSAGPPSDGNDEPIQADLAKQFKQLFLGAPRFMGQSRFRYFCPILLFFVLLTVNHSGFMLVKQAATVKDECIGSSSLDLNFRRLELWSAPPVIMMALT